MGIVVKMFLAAAIVGWLPLIAAVISDVTGIRALPVALLLIAAGTTWVTSIRSNVWDG